MKKKTVMTILLIVLPLLTVLIASSPSGVTVFDGQTARQISWMQTVPESPWGWCAPVAALMNYVLFALAVIYGLTKKDWCVTGIRGIAFVAGCVSVLPIVVQPEVKIIPNVLGSILLFSQWFVAYLMLKKTADEKERQPSGNRLDRR